MQNKEHDYRIDILRIVAMLQITGLHILGHGGVIDSLQIFSLNYEIAWFLKCLFFCGVNCYAMISGYVLLNHTIRISNIIILWVEVLSYSILMSFGITILTGNSISLKQLIDTLFPITRKQYWYTTVYCGLYFCIPYMNKVLMSFSMKQLKKMLFTILIIVSVIPTMVNYNLMDVPTGSLFWLMILFLLGAFIKKYGANNLFLFEMKKKESLLCFFIITILLYLSHFCIERLTFYLLGNARWGNWFILYTSPLVVLQALFLFNFFIEDRKQGEKSIHNMQFGSIRGGGR